jgi:hypothetical protein
VRHALPRLAGSAVVAAADTFKFVYASVFNKTPTLRSTRLIAACEEGGRQTGKVSALGYPRWGVLRSSACTAIAVLLSSLWQRTGVRPCGGGSHAMVQPKLNASALQGRRPSCIPLPPSLSRGCSSSSAPATLQCTLLPYSVPLMVRAGPTRYPCHNNNPHLKHVALITVPTDALSFQR